MSRAPAARLHAALVTVILALAACAHARAAFAFEAIPRQSPVRRPHRAAYACALAGAGLVAASFSLADRADRRYGLYLEETDPAAIPGRWSATVRADRVASGSLMAGEALLAVATYLRFIRQPASPRVALEVGPARCAVSCRF
jgi:hypothetical protein